MARIKDESQFMQHYKEYMAPECRAQLPAFNRVGRGLRGDGFIVEKDNDADHLIFIGSIVDAKTGDKKEVWRSDIATEMPTIGYRLYTGQVDGRDGWWIHFKAYIPATGVELWSFDTPFVFGEYTTEHPAAEADNAMLWSY